MDPQIALVLRPELPAVIEQVIAAVAHEVPSYAQPADAPISAVLQQGVAVALERLMDLLGRDDDSLGPAAAMYERIGSQEYQSQRPLQAVLAAYRVGALATWRGLSALSNRAGIDAVQTARLAEACFAYIDEISAASVAGYARAQSADAGRREAMRAALVEAIIDGASQAGVAGAAAQLGWPLPERVVVAVWSPVRAPEDALAARMGDLTVAVLVDGASVQARLAAFGASLGTSQPLQDAPASYAHAKALHALRSAGAVRVEGVASAADHLPEILLAADRAAADALISQVLRPLSGLDQQRRAVAVDTAASWLLNGGSRSAVAKQLHVHPQTVAYRMEGIRASFADLLSSSEGRWLLLLALRAEQQRRIDV